VFWFTSGWQAERVTSNLSSPGNKESQKVAVRIFRHILRSRGGGQKKKQGGWSRLHGIGTFGGLTHPWGGGGFGGGFFLVGVDRKPKSGRVGGWGGKPVANGVTKTRMPPGQVEAEGSRGDLTCVKRDNAAGRWK